MSSLIWGSSNIPVLSVSVLIRWNVWRKANSLPFLSIAFTKFFVTPNLICKDGSNILFGSTRGWDRTLFEPGFNLCLNSRSCLTLLVVSSVVQETQKTRILCVPTLEPYDQSNYLKISTDQTFALLVVNNRQIIIHAVVSFFHLYWMPKRDRWKTIPIL